MTAWDRYERWNSAIADVAFPPELAGTPVYLDLEEETVSRIAALAEPDASDGVAELVAAVRGVIKVEVRGEGTFNTIDARLNRWWRSARPSTAGGRRSVVLDPPPVLPLLATFSLAAERMGQDNLHAAHNYYDRLYEVLGITETWQCKKLQSDFMHSTEQYWVALNTWLSVHDGDRGLPTAFALSHRYVGLPMSQALLRAADRRRLPVMFNEYGLPPGYQISPSDMERLLDSWITRNPSPVTAATRSLWTKGEPRERISGVAALELAAWDGTMPGGGPANAAGGLARLSALVRSFPRKQLELGLLVRLPGVVEATTLRLTSTDGVAPEIDFTFSGGLLRLQRSDLIEARSMLDGVLHFQDAHGAEASRRPRRLVPLRFDEAQSVFVETERVQLGEDSILLVRHQILEQVVQLLELVARPGYQVFQSDLHGLPPGWAVVQDVQVLGAVPMDGKLVDLNVLVPLGTSQLTIADGLLLPGAMRKWSSLDPPEIRATTQGAGGVRITVEAEAGDATAGPTRTWESETGALVVPLAEERLPDGDYVVTLYESEGSSPVQQSRVRLRSGDWIDDASWSRARTLSHAVDDGALAALTATSAGRAEATVQGALSTATPRALLAGAAYVDARPWWTAEPSHPQMPRPIAIATPDSNSCMLTGFHHMDLPTVMPNEMGGDITGACRNCGLVKRYPTVFKRGRGHRKAEQRAAQPVDVSEVAPVVERIQTWEAALDGLFHLGGGPISQLERLALQVEASSLFLDVFLRSLEVLGHIEVERDTLHLRPLHWEVAPSCIAGLETGELALTGCWPASLRAAFADAVTARGGSFETKSALRGPVRWIAGELPADAASEIALELDVAHAPEAGRRILSTLPPLSTVLDALPVSQRPGARNLQRFDVGSASWTRVEECSIPGAYRFQSFDTLNGFRTEADLDDGTVRIGSVQLVKHLAALQQGKALVAYEPKARCLLVPLGADLPGLYGRAAVLCSGRLPDELPKERTLIYRNVPEDVAATFAALLSS